MLPIENVAIANTVMMIVNGADIVYVRLVVPSIASIGGADNDKSVLGNLVLACSRSNRRNTEVETMCELKPCPFCKGTDIRKYRFDVAVPISATQGALEIERPYGENYALECDCGCRLVKHMDDLHCQFYETHDYDIDFTDEMHWEFLIGIWNRRD